MPPITFSRRQALLSGAALGASLANAIPVARHNRAPDHRTALCRAMSPTMELSFGVRGRPEAKMLVEWATTESSRTLGAPRSCRWYTRDFLAKNSR